MHSIYTNKHNSGLFGAVVAGVAMEIFRQYRSILKIFTSFTCIAMIFLLWQLKPHNLTIVTIIFGIFGFVAVPIVAVTFEAAAECTYPANEELSSALLMTSGSIFGIAYILIWGTQLPDNGEQYQNQWNFSSYFLVINGFVMLTFMLLFRGEYKRLNAENQFSKYIEDLDDTSVIESETWNERQAQNDKRQHLLHGQSSNDNNKSILNKPISVNKQGIIPNSALAAYATGSADNSLDKPINYEQDV